MFDSGSKESDGAIFQESEIGHFVYESMELNEFLIYR